MNNRSRLFSTRLCLWGIWSLVGAHCELGPRKLWLDGGQPFPDSLFKVAALAHAHIFLVFRQSCNAFADTQVKLVTAGGRQAPALAYNMEGKGGKQG